MSSSIKIKDGRFDFAYVCIRGSTADLTKESVAFVIVMKRRKTKKMCMMMVMMMMNQSMGSKEKLKENPLNLSLFSQFTFLMELVCIAYEIEVVVVCC